MFDDGQLRHKRFFVQQGDISKAELGVSCIS